MTRSSQPRPASNMSSAVGRKGPSIILPDGKTRLPMQSRLIPTGCRARTAKDHCLLHRPGQAWARCSLPSPVFQRRSMRARKAGRGRRFRLRFIKERFGLRQRCLATCGKSRCGRIQYVDHGSGQSQRAISSAQTVNGFTTGCQTRASSSKPPRVTRSTHRLT